MNKEQQIVEFQNDILDNLFNGSTYKLAEALYNAGYRKLPEDSVVLSREEHEILVKTAQGKIGSGFMVEAVSTKEQVKQAIKEFAEKLKKRMGERDYMGVKYKQGVFSENDIDELLKEYEK